MNHIAWRIACLPTADSKPASPTVQDPWTLVLAFCDALSLLSCAQLAKRFRVAVAAEFRVRADHLFQIFFARRARHFMGLLRLHDAVVSGSTALALFLSPLDWEPGDLDVYVGDAHYDNFVCDLERFFPVTLDADMPSRHSAYYGYTGILGVRRYLTGSGKSIDVIRSQGPSAAEPLLYFWSSLVVNFITPRGAVCAFPRLTLSREGLVAHSGLSSKAMAARAKYKGHGVKFIEVGSWRPGGGSAMEDACILSLDPLLVLDFDSVWPSSPLRLPISRAGLGWVIKSPSNMGISGEKSFRCSRQ